MNILVVCHYGLYRNLTASFVHSQAKAYATLGHQVRVMIFVPMGKMYDGHRFGPMLSVKQVDGLMLYYLRFLSLSNFGEDWFNTPSGLMALRLHLSKILEVFCPNVIHAHTLGFDSEIGAWLKGRLGIPLVITAHGSDVFVPYDRGRRTPLCETAQKADHTVCVSTHLLQRLRDCGVTGPMSVILNGFCTPCVVSEKDKTLLSMIQAGYLVPRKKADVTIQALAILRRQYPDATLEIIGSGSELERFQALCRELGVENAVMFSGFLPNPETLAHMAKARFFVMPSVNEGFGIVYLEAMASGCITIGTEGEGIADLIVSGGNGFLVPPDDPEAIVHVIKWCLAHPDEAKTIAERGRRDAMSLTWEANVAHYTTLFKELIS